MHPTFEIDKGRLISTMVFALRHDLGHCGLDLDENGWTSFEDLVIAIRFDCYDWPLARAATLTTAIDGMDRFHIRDGRIRAMYGQSVKLGELPPLTSPPTVLFHGTTNDALPAICRDGLRPIGRRFVHFTSDRDYALRGANAKRGNAIILVQAADAHALGQIFRRANDRVWLTDQVEASLLTTECEQASA